MKTKISSLVSAIAIIVLAACSDSTDKMGYTITPSVDELTISTDTFFATSASVTVDSVLARSSYGYLGKMLDPETESYVTANFQTQFSNFTNGLVYSNDTVTPLKKEYNGKQMLIADSCILTLNINRYYGDSLNLLRMKMYEMEKPLEEGVNYYSNIDIPGGGYIREDGITKNVSWTALNQLFADTSTYVRHAIRIPLNDEYTDRDGNTWNNYGTYLIQKSLNSPDDFSTLYKFNHNVCPGFYFEHVDGLGTMAEFLNCGLLVYYDVAVEYPNDSTENDTIVATGSVIGSTNEVLTTTNIINDTEANERLADDNSCTYLKAPVGIFTEVELPVLDIMSGHETDTLNSAKIVFTRINADEQYDYSFDIPEELLMVQSDSLLSFFEKKKVTDSETSFTVSHSSNRYTFNNIASLITKMYSDYKEGTAKSSSWTTDNPNWNKVTLVPVTTTSTTTSSTESAIYHEMSLASTRLVGGDTEIAISVVYSKFNKQ